MRIVIVGDGKVGITLTEYLSKEGHDIIVIDNNPKVVEKVINSFDVMGISGNGASFEVQMEAEVNKADLLIAATSSDELNILCCMTAKKIGVKNTIARVRNPEYSKQLVFMQEELGLSMVVNPEYETAKAISRMLRSPAAIKIDDFSKNTAELAEIRITKENKFCGKTISELYKRSKLKLLICAVQRGDEVYIPKGDFVIEPEDRIHVTASHSGLISFLLSMGFMNEKIKNIMIIGGGKISFYLAKMLEGSGKYIKIIEYDEKRSMELSKALINVDVICADGSDQNILLEEGLVNMDAVVSLTDMDEENILISMFASAQKISKVITKVNRNSFINALSSFGLESTVSPKVIASNRIIRYVRGMQNAVDNSNVQTMYKIVNNQVEALEFKVAEQSRLIGIPLKEVQLKKDILIAGIVRKGELIVPRGDDAIKAMDSVIVVSKGQYLSDLDDVLK